MGWPACLWATGLGVYGGSLAGFLLQNLLRGTGIYGSPWPSILTLVASGILAACFFPCYKRFLWFSAPVLIGVSVLLASGLRDSSYDGLDTYAETLHWLTQDVSSLEEQEAKNEFQASQTRIRGSLSLGCVFANLTGSPESAKWPGWAWSLAGTCLLAASIFGLIRSRILAWMIVGTALLQPVFVYQGTTLYQDAQIGGAITGAFASFLILSMESSKRGWFGLALVLGCLSISKTFAAVYALLLAFHFCTGIFFAQKNRKNQMVIPMVLALAFMAPLGLPWLKKNRDRISFGRVPNQILLLADPLAIDEQGTDGIHGGCGEVVSNSAVMFWRRHFSASKRADDHPSIKPPFWFTRPELDVFSDLTPDLRFGGYGPLYGTAVLLALIPGLMLLLSTSPPQAGWKWILVTCLVMIPITPSWWARWFPQGWWIPFAACVGFLCGPGEWQAKFRWGTWLSRLGLVALGLNSVLILVFTVKGYVEAESIIRKQLTFVKSLPQPVAVHWERFGGARFWLDRENIQWRKEPVPLRPPTLRLYRTELDVALAEGDLTRLQKDHSDLAKTLLKKNLLQKP